MKNEIVEAVRERVRMADRWAKDTGYRPADYFDTMTDLRRLLAQCDALELTLEIAHQTIRENEALKK
jgi:hypothetical protein